jgi:hypothetical protein
MALDKKIGPYLYQDGWLAQKTFNDHQGIPRSFTVLIAGAYDAGIIGPEHNGIVVLDDDNRQVVLDQHVRESSGYYGPTVRQQAEFQRVMAMGWKEFTGFCRSHPRYRDCLPDATSPIPDDGRLPPSDEVIFPDANKPQDPECPYSFPLSTKREIIEFLAAHSGHAANTYDFALSWNIKVRSLDTSLEKYREEFEFDAQFDAKWEKLCETDESLFWNACSDGLSQWIEGDYAIYPGVNDGKYEFHTAGRSGGHLVLTKMFGSNMIFKGRHEYVEWLENDATDSELVELYKLVVNCDHDLARPRDEVEYQLATLRQIKEEEWRAELDEEEDPDESHTHGM